MFDDEDDEFGGDVGMGMGGAVPPGGRGGMGRVGPRRGAYDPRRLNGGGVRNPRCGGGGFGSMDTPDRRSGMRNGRPDRPSRRPGGGGRRPMPADGMQSGDWPPPGGGGSENWETQASGF
ncbi:hypothetical protein K432DRAFT_379981 [Lepidopterella palustris CBS 459.81]|uniref:Uncharacterized protein n=1 Tax=Lepidopterella palustris CBS 459.81 TaxID=1314670 RepID=A0A8E2EFC0_9PEZI|nr:hypothetical protein K432DRAFT_379981 [Lepidopterella palustris CBS 459.81]